MAASLFLRVAFVFALLMPVFSHANTGLSSDSTSSDSTSSDSTIASKGAFDVIEKSLITTKLKNVTSVVNQLLASVETQAQQTRALVLMQSMLDGELYVRKTDSQFVIAKKNSEGTFDLSDIDTQAVLANNVSKKRVKKIRTSNKVRKSLRISIAKLRLESGSVKQRIESIRDLMGNVDATVLVLLKDARVRERNSKVKAKLDEAIALGQLVNTDEHEVISALEVLDGSLEPQVRNAISRIAENSESDEVKRLARSTLESIESKVQFNGYLERIFFGLSLGSILLLVAAGLAITFGVMGVINMAHGELIMLGAYTTYVVQLMMPNHIEYSLLVAIPAAFLVSGLFGVAIERGVIQFLKGRPLETLLATFGISLVLQQLVRTIFSPLNRQVVTPEFMSGAWQINPVLSLTYNRIYILVFALVVFFLLQLLMRKTSLGLYVRAVSQNRNMARSMGIRSEWVDAMTFGLGSGVAGLAGVALSQITNVGPNLGQSYIIDSFMVVVFGGVGNLWGTFVGAFTIGALNKFLEPVTGAVLATIIVLVMIILFIQRRPRGLFPQKGRAAES